MLRRRDGAARWQWRGLKPFPTPFSRGVSATALATVRAGGASHWRCSLLGPRALPPPAFSRRGDGGGAAEGSSFRSPAVLQRRRGATSGGAEETACWPVALPSFSRRVAAAARKNDSPPVFTRLCGACCRSGASHCPSALRRIVIKTLIQSESARRADFLLTSTLSLSSSRERDTIFAQHRGSKIQ